MQNGLVIVMIRGYLPPLMRGDDTEIEEMPEVSPETGGPESEDEEAAGTAAMLYRKARSLPGTVEISPDGVRIIKDADSVDQPVPGDGARVAPSADIIQLGAEEDDADSDSLLSATAILLRETRQATRAMEDVGNGITENVPSRPSSGDHAESLAAPSPRASADLQVVARDQPPASPSSEEIFITKEEAEHAADGLLDLSELPVFDDPPMPLTIKLEPVVEVTVRTNPARGTPNDYDKVMQDRGEHVAELAGSVCSGDPAQQVKCREVLALIAEGKEVEPPLQEGVDPLARSPESLLFYGLLGMVNIPAEDLLGSIQRAGYACASLPIVLESCALGVYVDFDKNFTLRMRMTRREDISPSMEGRGTYRFSWINLLKGDTKSLGIAEPALNRDSKELYSQVYQKCGLRKFKGSDYDLLSDPSNPAVHFREHPGWWVPTANRIIWNQFPIPSYSNPAFHPSGTESADAAAEKAFRMNAGSASTLMNLELQVRNSAKTVSHAELNAHISRVDPASLLSKTNLAGSDLEGGIRSTFTAEHRGIIREPSFSGTYHSDGLCGLHCSGGLWKCHGEW